MTEYVRSPSLARAPWLVVSEGNVIGWLSPVQPMLREPRRGGLLAGAFLPHARKPRRAASSMMSR
ncbi:conserved protein of unknown function [Rhodovastum atsumiense]|nr:conserved protein of unknown function [Rhodovastum atsumiense]